MALVASLMPRHLYLCRFISSEGMMIMLTYAYCIAIRLANSNAARAPDPPIPSCVPHVRLVLRPSLSCGDKVFSPPCWFFGVNAREGRGVSAPTDVPELPKESI